jgi:hypothetical protein
VQAGRGRQHVEGLLGGEAGDDPGVALRILPAGPAHVPGELPVVDEPGQRSLHGDLAVPVTELARRHQRRAQSRRRQHEPGPHGRQHGLGERPGIEHPAGGVQAVQRLQRPGGIPELAVVVVLDDRGRAAARPVQQRVAAGQAHRAAQRELVRRRRVDQPGRGGQRVHPDPLGVHRHAGDPGADRGEQPPRRRITRLLHRHHVAGAEQDPGDQVERVLGAVGDHHVVGGGPDRPGDAEIAGDRGAQGRVAGGFRVRAGAVRPQPHLRGQQPPPGVEREQLRVRDAGAEVVSRRHGVRADRQRPERPAGPRAERIGVRPPG